MPIILLFLVVGILWWFSGQSPLVPPAVPAVPNAIPLPHAAPIVPQPPTTGWTDAWTTPTSGAAAAMLAAALILVVLIVGVQWYRKGWKAGFKTLGSLLLYLILASVAVCLVLLIVGWLKDTEVLRWYGALTTTEWVFVLVLALGLPFVVARALNEWSHPLVRWATVLSAVVVGIILVPSLARWVEESDLICLSGKATCAQARADYDVREAKRLANIEYARQSAQEKAKYDATRLVSPVCPGDMGTIRVVEGTSPEINSEGCSMPVDVVSGKIVFVGRWWQKSKAFSPGECIKLDFPPTAVEAAPGYAAASLHYAKCRGGGGRPLSFNCEPMPQQKLAACS